MAGVELQRALEEFVGASGGIDELLANAVHMDPATRTLAEVVRAARDLLAEPTNVQALALARLMRDRPDAQVVVHRGVFDLPNGYWLAIVGVDGFQCGIAPDGSVSS